MASLWLLFQLTSAGMFISSAALLPSSFSMYITLATMAAWLNEDTRTAIAVTAFSGLIGMWPILNTSSFQNCWKRTNPFFYTQVGLSLL